FTLASVAALHSSSFVSSYSNSERQAGAHMLLRHNSHLDGTHYHTRTPTGLQPSYIAFNEVLTSPDKRMITQEEFVEAMLQDIFDAVCMQDCLDRGISLLIHCPGSHAMSTLLAECIIVDLYVTPHEFHEQAANLTKALNADLQLQKLDMNPKVHNLHSLVIHLLNDSSAKEITKNPDATMWWVHYGHNVVSHYQVIVKGWPDRIPFNNLSKAASGITALE
ncbi:hypothetical protein EV702DRAFT_937147, partial [Suillus placidus]